MSNIKRIGAGPRMSQAVVRGNAVYTAGQVADKTKGGSVADQTREILAQIDALSPKPAAPRRISSSATIYLADIATFAEMNGVWDEWVDKANPPRARHRRSEARRAGLQGRDRRHRGALAHFRRSGRLRR